MAGPPSDYEDDAARIDREYIPDDATTQAEIDAALDAAGFPSASQSHISGWLVTAEDAWGMVGEGGSVKVTDTGSVERAIRRESSGTISSGRARSIANEVGGQIASARREAASRVTDSGQIIEEGGGFGPSLQNAEEVVRSDGIYYRAQDTGREFLGASFDR